MIIQLIEKSIKIQALLFSCLAAAGPVGQNTLHPKTTDAQVQSAEKKQLVSFEKMMQLKDQCFSNICSFLEAKEITRLACTNQHIYQKLSPHCATGFMSHLKEECEKGNLSLFWEALCAEAHFYLTEKQEKNLWEQALMHPPRKISFAKQLTPSHPLLLKTSSTAWEQKRISYAQWVQKLRESSLPLMIEDPDLLKETQLIGQIIRCRIDLNGRSDATLSWIEPIITKNKIQISIFLTPDYQVNSNMHSAFLKQLLYTGQVSELVILGKNFNWERWCPIIPNLKTLKSFIYHPFEKDPSLSCSEFQKIMSLLSEKSPPLKKMQLPKLTNNITWTLEELALIRPAPQTLTEFRMDTLDRFINLAPLFCKILPQTLHYFLPNSEYAHQGTLRTISKHIDQPYCLLSRFSNLLRFDVVLSCYTMGSNIQLFSDDLLKHKNLENLICRMSFKDSDLVFWTERLRFFPQLKKLSFLFVIPSFDRHFIQSIASKKSLHNFKESLGRLPLLQKVHIHLGSDTEDRVACAFFAGSLFSSLPDHIKFIF
jgi:hypothetical protein